MPRARRFTYAQALHHVTMRCNNKEFLFEHSSFVMLMDLLAEACAKFEVPLHDYCLMTNHVHLHFQVPADDVLSDFMHWLENVFAKRFNRLRGRKGHLWEDRFHSTIIEPGCSLRCMAYIDLNPVRAGMVRTPSEYPWSGHAAIKAQDQTLISLSPDYLSLAANKAARYKAYWREIQAEAARKPFSLANVLFLGSKEFMENQIERFGLGTTTRPRICRLDLGNGLWGAEPTKGGSSSRCQAP